MSDEEIRAKLDRHWATCGDLDQDAAHEIYHDDCVVEWPQSGERVRGKANLHALRTAHPSRLEFDVRRILGGGDLWITEYTIAYDGARCTWSASWSSATGSSSARPTSSASRSTHRPGGRDGSNGSTSGELDQ